MTEANIAIRNQALHWLRDDVFRDNQDTSANPWRGFVNTLRTNHENNFLTTARGFTQDQITRLSQQERSQILRVGPGGISQEDRQRIDAQTNASLRDIRTRVANDIEHNQRPDLRAIFDQSGTTLTGSVVNGAFNGNISGGFIDGIKTIVGNMLSHLPPVKQFLGTAAVYVSSLFSDRTLTWEEAGIEAATRQTVNPLVQALTGFTSNAADAEVMRSRFTHLYTHPEAAPTPGSTGGSPTSSNTQPPLSQQQIQNIGLAVTSALGPLPGIPALAITSPPATPGAPPGGPSSPTP